MHVLEGFQDLVENELGVNILQNFRLDHHMQIRLHKITDYVNVHVVIRPEYIRDRNDVLMSVQLLQEHNLSVGTLCI